MARTAVAPRRGGLDTISTVDIAWTGRNPYDANIVAPTANGCYRPIDPDKARKVEDKCVQPLPHQRPGYHRFVGISQAYVDDL